MLVYLHGFASSGQSLKARRLGEWLAPLPVLAPTYPPAPPRAGAFLHKYIQNQLTERRPERLLLVGSSLGGYYGAWLAREFGCGLVLINPALDPVGVLRPLLGENRIYCSGERFYFGPEDLQALARFACAEPCVGAGPRLLLVDLGDEVIDPQLAMTRYRECARCLAFDGGDHGFAHLRESLDAIVETYRACPPIPLAAGA